MSFLDTVAHAAGSAARGAADAASDAADTATSVAEDVVDAATAASAGVQAGTEVAGAAASVAAAAVVVAAAVVTSGVGAAGSVAVAAMAVAIAASATAVAAGSAAAAASTAFVRVFAAVAAFQGAVAPAGAMAAAEKIRIEASKIDAAIQALLLELQKLEDKAKDNKIKEDNVQNSSPDEAAARAAAIIDDIKKALSNMTAMWQATQKLGAPAPSKTPDQLQQLNVVISRLGATAYLKIPNVPGKSAAVASIQQLKAQFQLAMRNFAAIQAAAAAPKLQPVKSVNAGSPSVVGKAPGSS